MFDRVWSFLLSYRVRDFAMFMLALTTGAALLFSPVWFGILMRFSREHAPSVHMALTMALFVAFGLFVLAMFFFSSLAAIVIIVDTVQRRRVEKGAGCGFLIAAAFALPSGWIIFSFGRMILLELLGA